MADQWSIAWRVLDAQFFGVPQRRKRIYLICDFASGRAGQILFEPQRVFRDLAPGCSEKQKPSHQSSSRHSRGKQIFRCVRLADAGR
ncbi:DNA cytosine methyltransferase [Mobiluncus curtisii]|uniref:DNA cytosine methyltransferase n=1 Tax=Mobiluncus curtisii TaxID=2051 RepID=UPI002093849B|nr:DNA cytosine methyltransferase [Mobiluncus curtisii]